MPWTNLYRATFQWIICYRSFPFSFSFPPIKTTTTTTISAKFLTKLKVNFVLFCFFSFWWRPVDYIVQSLGDHHVDFLSPTNCTTQILYSDKFRTKQIYYQGNIVLQSKQNLTSLIYRKDIFFCSNEVTSVANSFIRRILWLTFDLKLSWLIAFVCWGFKFFHLDVHLNLSGDKMKLFADTPHLNTTIESVFSQEELEFQMGHLNAVDGHLY